MEWFGLVFLIRDTILGLGLVEFHFEMLARIVSKNGGALAIDRITQEAIQKDRSIFLYLPR